MKNTLTTSFGYLVSLVRKYTPLSARAESLEDIYNYLPINERLYSSGQPSEAQFEVIKKAGFKYVINLAPHNAENSLQDEAGLLKTLGLEYQHIPVNFVRPSERKFDQFVAAMDALENERVWVHCAANMRVSAFIYRYRVEVLKERPESAQKDLHKIWQPIGVWKRFTKT